MRGLYAGIALSLGSLTASGTAHDLTVPPNAAWQHAQTGLIFSRKVSGLPRTGIADSGTSELDVAIQYASDDGHLWATIYVFRPADNFVPVWFEQSRQQIEHRPGYLLPEGAGRMLPTAFSPIADGTKTGLRLTYPLEKPKLNGTALAIAPVGGWLVAVRMSSTLMSVEGLDARLTEFLAGIRWPASARSGPEAVPITACPDALTFKKAKVVKPDLGNTLIDSMMGIVMAAEQAKKATPSPPPTFCKDVSSLPLQGTYRPNGAADRYIIALQDAGESIAIEPAIDVSGHDRVSVTLRKLDRDIVFPSFNRLPSPQQVRELVDGGNALSSTARNGDSTTIGMPQR